jgi:uncharacterized protein
MLTASREMIVDSGGGVRLLGYYSPQPSPASAAGTVALIHGWEGSADSAYILSAGRYLYSRGFNIFRLNLRDHGESHHLNEGLFHGALIDETFNAVREIAGLEPGSPFYLLGFSLGANFSLRIALRQSRTKIANLRHVVAISPALDPYKATVSIDTGFAFYRRYFLNKWKRSLRKKQQLFPDRYRFDEVLKMQTCMEMTEAVMIYYPEFADYQDYFGHYTLLKDVFRYLQVPVTIIASEDDPVIPIADFHGLEQNPNLTLAVQRYGGHCGFFNAIPFDCWHEQRVEAIFKGSEP